MYEIKKRGDSGGGGWGGDYLGCQSPLDVIGSNLWRAWCKN